MRNNLTWILLLVLACVSVSPLPVHELRGPEEDGTSQLNHHSSDRPPGQGHSSEEKVISVRITSSIAVGRRKAKTDILVDERQESEQSEPQVGTTATETHLSTVTDKTFKENFELATSVPTEFKGANMEFLKQLQSKKEARALNKYEKVQAFPRARNEYSHINDTDDNYAESSESLGSVIEIEDKQKEIDEINENIPMARSLSQSPSPKNFIQGLNPKSPSERGHSRLTTVSFNIVHDTPKVTSHYTSTDIYQDPHQTFTNSPTFYNPPKIYNEPSKVYSQPAKVYSEPSKFYSEPAKIYSEPAKVYGEPAKVYSEPAKIYSEPSKFYSQPASLHLSPDVRSSISWQQQSQSSGISSTTVTTTPGSTVAQYTQSSTGPSSERIEHQAEKNYEIDEKVSVVSEGRSHGVQAQVQEMQEMQEVQEGSTESCKQENCKVGYVVEGRQYRKYRVEERTADGFLVGEYGVVRNEDGALRGVRYTADGDASPRLIYDALMKFLQLK